jgi:hypothetical protein
MLSHNVYFTLKDQSEDKKQELVAACEKYLKPRQGVVFFDAGVLCEELNREVNDQDWQVGLHVIFDTKENQDIYQTAPEHLQFIEENKENWEKVRVFDTISNS